MIQNLDIGKQDHKGQLYIIAVSMDDDVIELIRFTGRIEEARKRAEVFALGGKYKIYDRG